LIRRTSLWLGLLLALGAGGCKRPLSARPPLKSSTGQPFRLGWVTWSDVDELLYCNRRIDDNGEQVGVLGPCFRLAAGERPKQIMSWLNAGRPDATPPLAGPWDRCTLEHKGDSNGAQLTLVTPTKKEPLEDWQPDSKVGGDAYAVEVSFSPEGKWMAVVHVAIHLGDGERIIEIPFVDIRPVPACR
jgi:hypothetical protein